MIFRHWLRENAVLAIGYALLLAINAVASVRYWPDLRDNIPQVLKLIPIPQIQELFRAIEEYGYWAYVSFQQFWKAAGVFGVAAAGLMGTGIVARDVDNRTAELLLSRPISRGRIFFARWSAGALMLTVPLVATTLISVGMAGGVDEELSTRLALAGSGYVSLFVLAVYTLTCALSAWSSHAMRGAILAMGFMLLQFALYMIKDLYDWSLYNLVDLDPLIPISDGVFPWRNALSLTGAILLFYGAGWLRFERRDF